MAENIHKNDHSAGLYRAMARRFYSRYVEMRESAHHRGGDLTDHGRLDTEREADQRYLAAVEEWLWETPDSAEAALALVEFAGILAADRFVGTITNEPINDERDAYHQSRALADVARWINSRLYDELAEQERRKKLERCKLRAVGGQDDDDDPPAA